MLSLVVTVFSYLVGSFPTGYLLGSASGVNLRATGSGNIGATNVARTLGFGKGILTLVVDVTKGFIPVYIASYLGLDPFVVALSGFVAFLGHLFPVFLRFRGGKGVATAFGIFVCIMPLAALVLLAVFLLVVSISRLVSLASVKVAILAPLISFLFDYPLTLVWMSAAIGVLVVLRHIQNIRRIYLGTEAKLGSRL